MHQLPRETILLAILGSNLGIEAENLAVLLPLFGLLQATYFVQRDATRREDFSTGLLESAIDRHLGGRRILSLHCARRQHLNERASLHLNDTGEASFGAWKHSTRLRYEDTKRRLFKPLLASRPSSGRARRLF